MIPKEEADSKKILIAGKILRDEMVLIDDAESTRENKLLISQLW